MIFWQLLSPARPGHEADLLTIERRIDVLHDQLEGADEAGAEAIYGELETLRIRRRAFAEPVERTMQHAGSSPLAIPMPAAPSEVGGPFALDASLLVQPDFFEPAIMDELLQRHDAAEALAFKDRLLVAIHELAVAPVVDEDSKLFAGLVVCAANWLAFWGERGYGFEVLEAVEADDDDEEV